MNTTVQHIYDISQSGFYISTVSIAIMLSIILFIGMILFALIELFRGMGKYNDDAEGEKSLLIIFTLRDTFLVTSIYVIVDLMRSIQIYHAGGTTVQPVLLGYFSLLSPIAEFILHCILALIVFRRLNILKRWLSANKISKS